MKALSLFSGIGGLDLAAEAYGIETAAFCEIEPYAVKVLERRWPGVPIIDDVRKIKGCDWPVDVIHEMLGQCRGSSTGTPDIRGDKANP